MKPVMWYLSRTRTLLVYPIPDGFLESMPSSNETSVSIPHDIHVVAERGRSDAEKTLELSQCPYIALTTKRRGKITRWIKPADGVQQWKIPPEHGGSSTGRSHAIPCNHAWMKERRGDQWANMLRDNETRILPSTAACKLFFRDRLWLTAAAAGLGADSGSAEDGGFVRLI